MSDREKLDRIKEKTGISSLDEKTRKDLFNKFVEAGGEVINDKRQRRQMMIDRQKQQVFRQKMDEHHRRINSEKTQRDKNSGTVTGSTGHGTKKEPSTGLWTRLRIRLNMKMLRIAQFNGLYFEYRFLERFNNIHKPALMEIQVIFLDLFKTKPERGNAIIRRMDKARPIYYELVEMAGSIYDRMTVDPIVEHYNSFPDVPKKISELYDPLMDIYRSLLILKPFENTLFKSFEMAVELGIRYTEDEKNRNNSYPAYRKKIKNDLYDLFHRLFPRLHWLFCHYQGTIYDMGDPRIETILGITSAEKPGNRKLVKPEDEILQTNTETAKEEDPHASLPDHIRKGLELIAALDLQTLRKEFDKKGLFQDVPDSDKILVSYLLFNEYDREYSPVLTTNKIKYNIDFGGGGKADYRTQMQDLYDAMRSCADAMRDYAEAVTLYEQVRGEKPESNTQYIVYTKRLEAIQKKKSEAGRSARFKLKEYMGKTEETVGALVEDMNSQQRYVANPQDELVFEPNIEGEKKINGLKVYEAIGHLYSFAGAFAYRLGSEGDLSGKLEFSETEMPAGREKSAETGPSGTPAPQNKKETSDTEKPRSILDELDDLL